MESPFIRVKKVTDKKDDTLGIDTESFRVNEIKSFRAWRKTPDEEKLTPHGMTQLAMYSNTAKDGFYNIRIVETEEEFIKRLGKNTVIDIN